jgi:hypothetical protein
MADGTVYEIKRRLGWQEQARVDQAAFKLIVDGYAIAELSAVTGLQGLKEMEMRPTPEAQNTARLQCRLVNVTPRQVPALPARHVKVLIARIEALEAEEKAEEEALAEGGPFEPPLSNSASRR